ncbi:hypothetical protein IPZ70_15770 [Streptomyces polychromogenes]|nr:hypothetical protein [Streptomyces polychromogenes]
MIRDARLWHRLTTACAAAALNLAPPPGGGQHEETTWSPAPLDAADINLLGQ